MATLTCCVQTQGTNWMTFAEFQAFTKQGAKAQLTVLSQSTEHTKEGQWSAEATLDGNVHTCYCTKAGNEKTAHIVYEMSKPIQVTKYVFDNKNRCSYGPVTEIRILGTTSGSTWHELIPWTKVGLEIKTLSTFGMYAYVCMYVWLYMHIFMHGMHAWLCMYACMYAYVRLCMVMHGYARLFMYIYGDVLLSVHVYACIYASMYAFMYSRA